MKWSPKFKKIYDSVEKKKIQLRFYRLNVIDFYNFNMGNVDLADQLRNYYRMDTKWHRNRKWWWSVWWWGVQVLLTNSYWCYVKFHQLIDTKESEVMSHYDFIKRIALAWIDPDTHAPERLRSKRILSYDDVEDGSVRTRRRFISDSTTISGLTSEDIGESRKKSNATVSDLSLHPFKGKLKCRLLTSVQHLPEASVCKKPRCQLHRWARNRNGGEVMAGIIRCSYCQVDLCVRCFQLFHKEGNLIDKRNRIASNKE